MIYILYNPLCGNGKKKTVKKVCKRLCPHKKKVIQDITQMKNIGKFLGNLRAKDEVILVGGDGTLNHFANSLTRRTYPFRISLFPYGTGNDFLTDVAGELPTKPLTINKYLADLPTVQVNGETYRFVDNVGFGIDGYCCEIGDKIHAEHPKQAVNYASIAIKGMLGKYAPTTATVVVDGEEKVFENVWLAPTMNGRYYGGGMKIAPEQDRLNPEHTLTLVVLHSKSRLKTLIAFPSIFKGNHVNKHDMVEIMTGKEISVTFDRPTSLQIDGETFLDVTTYSATAAPVVRERGGLFARSAYKEEEPAVSGEAAVPVEEKTEE